MNKWLDEHRMLVFLIIGLAIASGPIAFAIKWQPPPAIIINPPPPTPTPGPIQVYVSGAVVEPDVYTLSPDSIVQDVIEAAGGATHQADLNRINLAAPLTDGEQVHVPEIGEVPTSSTDDNGDVVNAGPININTATQAELETLPGIGPATAAAIIQYREENGPFETIEQIQNVPGIGPAKFEQIKDLITVGL